MNTTDLFSLKGRSALITGGSRGIGRMIAEGFLAQGARVYISARKAAACDQTAAELSQFGTCISLPADVANGEDVGHVGAHLDVDVDEASVRHGHACLVGDNRKQVYFALSAVTGHKYATASEWRNWYAKTQSVPSSDPPHE